MEELHDATAVHVKGTNFRYGYPVCPSTHQPSLLPEPIILVPPGGSHASHAHEDVGGVSRTEGEVQGEKGKTSKKRSAEKGGKGSGTQSERSRTTEEMPHKKRKETKRVTDAEKRGCEKPTKEVVMRKRNEEVEAQKREEQTAKKAGEKKEDNESEARKAKEDKRREGQEIPRNEKDAKKRSIGVVKPKMDGEEDWTRNRNTPGEGISREMEPRRDDRRYLANERERSPSPRRARRHSRSRSHGRSSRDRTACPRYRRASPRRTSPSPRRLEDHPVWAAFKKMFEAYERR